MIVKILGIWLCIDGLGSMYVHRADRKKSRPRSKKSFAESQLRSDTALVDRFIIETIVRVVRITIGAALVAVG